MKKDYTILCPQMSPIHFALIEPALKSCGFNIRVLPNDNKAAVDVGLKYVNNDACYPSLMVVGQIMAVSYTHLDVYKRQGPEGAGAGIRAGRDKRNGSKIASAMPKNG